MTEIQTNQLPEDMISVSDLDVLTWFGISDFGIRISADSLFLILHPMLLRLGVPKAREYLAKRPQKARKGTGEKAFVRFRGIRVRGKRHLMHFFLKTAAKVPFSNSSEFFKCQIGHPKHPHSPRIPDDGPERYPFFISSRTEQEGLT